MIRGIEGIMTLIDICASFGGLVVHQMKLEKIKTLAPKNKGQGAQKYNL
jgi:hypothetical protein